MRVKQPEQFNPEREYKPGERCIYRGMILIAEVINRNSMESEFNDTPDFILARVAVEAMEIFTRASAHRDDYHEFRTADYEKKGNAILNISDIDINTITGKMLLMAIAKITTESQTDKTPDDVLKQISKLVKAVFNEKTCKDCPFTDICPDVQMKRQPEPKRKRQYNKPEAFDMPKEVQTMAEFFGEMFPGTMVEIHRVEMPRRNPRNKRREKNKRNGGRRNETR